MSTLSGFSSPNLFCSHVIHRMLLTVVNGNASSTYVDGAETTLLRIFSLLEAMAQLPPWL